MKAAITAICFALTCSGCTNIGVVQTAPGAVASVYQNVSQGVVEVAKPETSQAAKTTPVISGFADTQQPNNQITSFIRKPAVTAYGRSMGSIECALFDNGKRKCYNIDGVSLYEARKAAGIYPIETDE